MKGETFEFIIQLQEYDCLWDISKQAYSNRSSKDKAFEVMASKLNCSITDVQKKIKTLRTKLIRENNKTKNSQNGDGAEDIKNSDWEHWDALQFMLPTITPEKSIDNFQAMDTQDVTQDDAKTMTPRKRTPRRTPKKKLNKDNIYFLKKGAKPSPRVSIF